MNDAPESKQTALDNLRTWRGWFDRRDPLIYAAHLAGASLTEIRDASGVAINTARSAITAQEATVQTATDPHAKYHHPHFVSVERTRTGGWKFTFKAFTGQEPEPEAPQAIHRDDTVPHEQKSVLFREYDVAKEMWGTARFHLRARPLVPEIAPLWDAYQQARTAMNAAFDSLMSTSDNTWRAQVMKLTSLHREAREAADTWDQAAKRLAAVYEEYLRDVGMARAEPMSFIFSGYDIDTTDWNLETVKDYEQLSWHYGEFLTPSVRAIAKEIDQQKTRIREVADLTGETTDQH